MINHIIIMLYKVITVIINNYGFTAQYKKIVKEKGNEKCVCVLKAKLYLSANLYYNTRRESKGKILYMHVRTYLM